MNNKSIISKKDNGFTLVELSIVLVIIGLIVGGIVGGRSLIASARINSVVRELQNYQIALKAFELQYDAKPGDFSEALDYWPSLSVPTCSPDYGNGDGVIKPNGNQREYISAWYHLEAAELIHNDLVNISGYTYNKTYPLSKALNGKGGYFIGLLRNTGGSPYDSGWINKEGILLARTQNFFTVGDKGVFSTKDAKSIDTKIDDGMPGTGQILGRRARRPDGANACSNAADVATTPPTEWNLQDPNINCTIVLLLD